MDANAILIAAAMAILGFLAAQLVKRQESETKTLRDEVNAISNGFARLETKLEGWIDRVSTAATHQPAQANPLQVVLDTLTVIEKLKTIGLLSVSAAR